MAPVVWLRSISVTWLGVPKAASDSSDVHEEIAAIAKEATVGFDGEVIIEYSSTTGITVQRKIGLAHVVSDIVF